MIEISLVCKRHVLHFGKVRRPEAHVQAAGNEEKRLERSINSPRLYHLLVNFSGGRRAAQRSHSGTQPLLSRPRIIARLHVVPEGTMTAREEQSICDKVHCARHETHFVKPGYSDESHQGKAECRSEKIED